MAAKRTYDSLCTGDLIARAFKNRDRQALGALLDAARDAAHNDAHEASPFVPGGVGDADERKRAALLYAAADYLDTVLMPRG